MDTKNERVENEVLSHDKKLYRLQNNPTINYNNTGYNWISMGWNNLLVGSHGLHNVVKTYVNFVNYIATFVDPTITTNIIKNETILNQYSIKQGLEVFGKNARLQHENNFISFMTAELLSQRNLNTSAMNKEERSWHT